jgi:hypothetical protein
METQVCDIIVRYKQDKKTVSHNSTGLSDLRSLCLSWRHMPEMLNAVSTSRRNFSRSSLFFTVFCLVFSLSSTFIKRSVCFRMETQVCDIIVRYKQDKKTVSHNSTGLSDLRSRALLLINVEDREKTRQKTVKKREDLEKFLQLVDTAL